MGARLVFGVLGPLEVRLDDAEVRVGGPRQRALLGLLLCHANRVVSRDQLIEELLGDQPPAAAAQWARLDRQLTDLAIWVPTVTANELDFLSSRVRNYQYNPVWGALIDQFWIR